MKLEPKFLFKLFLHESEVEFTIIPRLEINLHSKNRKSNYSLMNIWFANKPKNYIIQKFNCVRQIEG